MGMEEKDKKAGTELFRELLRLFPGAHVEDYYKNGQWQVETILIDTELIEAHRKEAGAPDPPPLEEVELPTLPKPVGLAASGLVRPTTSSMPIRPAAPTMAPTPGAPSRFMMGGPTTSSSFNPAIKRIAVTKPTVSMLKKPIIKPTQPTGSPSVSTTAGTVHGTDGVPSSTAAGGPSAELRQIALFIQKWKLEATKAKLLLARLTPTRRRWVMKNFTGMATLEEYIAHCDRTNAWAAVGSLGSGSNSGNNAGAAPAPTSGAKFSGTKRPLNGSMFAERPDPSKRPCLAGPQGGRWNHGALPGPTAGPRQPSMAPPGFIRGTVGSRLAVSSSMKPTVGPKAAAVRPATASFVPTKPPNGLGPKPSSSGNIPAGYSAKAEIHEEPGALIRSLLQRA